MPGRRADRRRGRTAGGGYAGYGYYPGGSATPGYGYYPEPEDRPGVPTRVFWWCVRHKVWVGPFGALALLVLLQPLMSHTRHGTGLTGVAAGLMTVMMWIMAARRWEGPEVTFARWATLGGSGWLVAAVYYGVGPIMWLVLAAGWLYGSVLWWSHKLPRPPKPDPFRDGWAGRWEEIRDLPRINLPGSKVVDAEGDDDYPILTMKMVGGSQSVDDLRAAAKYICGAWEMGERIVRIEDVAKDASLARLKVRRVTSIDTEVKWNPAHAPTSVSQPLWLGRKESGGDFYNTLLLKHWKFAGLTRWGKSNLIDTILANLAQCDDVIPLLIDLKQGRTGRAWLPLLGGLATTYEEAVLLVTALNAMMAERSAKVATASRQIVPSPACPAFVLIFDELAEGIGSAKPDSDLQRELETYTRLGAGLGFYFVGAGQDGSLETWGTEKIRAACYEGFCLRTAKPEHAQYILAKQSQVNTTHIALKGAYYFSDGATDSELIRAPLMEPTADPYLIARIVAERAPHMAQPDAVTAAGGGQAWAERWRRLPAAFHDAASPAQLAEAGAGAPAAQPAAAAPPAQPATPASPFEGETTMPTPDTGAQPRPDSPYARAAAAEQEAMEVSQSALPVDLLRQAAAMRSAGVLPPLDLAAEMAKGADRVAVAIAMSGAAGVPPKRLYNKRGQEGLMSRAWVNERLNALREAHVIEPVPGATEKGAIRPVDHADPAAALQKIQQVFTNYRRTLEPAGT